MTATVADAQNIVQDTWVRWMGAAQERVNDPLAYWVRTATRFVEEFWRASRTGDLEVLTRLLMLDVEIRTDGGGRVPSALNALHGRDRAVRFFVGLARKFAVHGTLVRFATVHRAS